MKKMSSFVIVCVLFFAPLLLYAEGTWQTGNIAVASNDKSPEAPVADKMGRSPFYLLFDRQANFIKAAENPNFGKGGRTAGTSAIDTVGFDENGRMTGGIATPSRQDRDQIWSGFSDFFTRNGISVVVAEEFGDQIVRGMKTRGIECIAFKGSAQEAVGHIVKKSPRP
jgi:predicted Fe-Mo cluster-binding NifX family protein